MNQKESTSVRVKSSYKKTKAWWLFTRELIRGPKSVGAACPSSASLARTIAAHVPLDQPGKVVELGAGTGSVTHALLDYAVSQEDLWIVERSSSMSAFLQKEFPSTSVFCGDAMHLSSLLEDSRSASSAVPVRAVVSSLPLRIFSQEVREKILEEITSVLAPGGVYIQYTYHLKQQEYDTLGPLKRVAHEYIWLNLPPARVDVFKMLEVND